MNGDDGLEQFRKKQFDLCIFDVMMPHKDGFTLAAEIANYDQKTPLIFLTAKSLKDDVIRGMKLGADDYIIKPFDSDVLLLKINAILNRYKQAEKPANQLINIGKYDFDPKVRLLRCEEHNIKLSPKESELLLLLCEHINNIMPRNIALKKIWEEDNYFTARSMDVYIAKLRKHFHADETVSIDNIHGNGYSLQIKKSS